MGRSKSSKSGSRRSASRSNAGFRKGRAVARSAAGKRGDAGADRYAAALSLIDSNPINIDDACAANPDLAAAIADARDHSDALLSWLLPSHRERDAGMLERVRSVSVPDFNPHYGSYTSSEFNSRFDGDPKQDGHCSACAFYRDTDQSAVPYVLAYTGTGGYAHAHAYGDLSPNGTRPQLAPVRHRNANRKANATARDADT